MKSKKINLLYLFFIVLPFIDLITSLTTRLFDFPLSLGMIIKGALLFFGAIYVLFRSVSKYRKVTLIFFVMCLVYVLGYFILKPDLISKEFFATEFNYIIKLLYFPLMTFVMLNIFDDYGFAENKFNKILIINLICYIALIVLPTILNINFDSYSNSEYAGSVGWFYAANEVSTILLLLYPFIYKYMKKNKLILVGVFATSLYTISLIGTKVTLFGIIIISFLLLLCTLFHKKKDNYLSSVLSSIMLIIVLIVMSNNYAAMNLKSSLTEADLIEIDNIKEELESDEGLKNNEFIDFIKKYGEPLLSHRNTYALNTWVIYRDNYKPYYLLFGMGFSNTARVNDYFVEKLIEIDFLDMFFHMGLGAVFIWLFPFIYVLCIIIKNRKFNVEIVFFIMMILMTIGISSLAGHVYLAPAVSLYVSLYFCFLVNSCGGFKRVDIKTDKIVILGMHLGYGGVENVIATTASMLCEKYDVEIVSLYKNKEEIPFKIDDKVTITYLFDTISNRREFLDVLHKFNVKGIIKEGIKSCYILIHKSVRMKRYIVRSNAKMLISTRLEYSRLLNEFGRDKTIKIHQEHTYNVEDKYVGKLNRLKYLDYIMPVSKVLCNKYKGRVSVPIMFIPLALDYYPKNSELSKLDTKQLITLGRLEPVKGYKDLIDVMEILVKNDKEITLNIFGDGSEFESLKEIISQKNLSNNVKLWGYKTHKFIQSFMINSSLYVMSSLEESFGLVLIEAMSYGIPCIAFSSAEGAKSILNKSNGFMVDDRNKDEMAHMILDYFAMPNDKRMDLGKNARKTSEEYKYATVKKKWLKFVKDNLS